MEPHCSALTGVDSPKKRMNVLSCFRLLCADAQPAENHGGKEVPLLPAAGTSLLAGPRWKDSEPHYPADPVSTQDERGL